MKRRLERTPHLTPSQALDEAQRAEQAGDLQRLGTMDAATARGLAELVTIGMACEECGMGVRRWGVGPRNCRL